VTVSTNCPARELKRILKMPRGPLSEETKKKRLIELQAQLLGKSVDEIKEMVSDRVETNEDKTIQAVAVEEFLSTKRSFRFETCRWCGETFAYHHRVSSVKHCSVQCNHQTLKAMGLAWNPDKSPQERWGVSVPAVVPPTALQALYNIYVLLKDRFDGIDPEELQLKPPGPSVSQNE
jgi:hypothetical protein